MSKVFSEGYALVIGVGDDRPHAVDDAEAVAGLLENPERCAYPPDQIRLLAGGQATRSGILAALDDLAGRLSPPSTLIFYFSGEISRITSTTGQGSYLLPSGYNLADLASSSIRVEELAGRLANLPVQNLLVLIDSGYPPGVLAPMIPGLQVEPDPAIQALFDLFRPGGRSGALLAAVQPGEQAFDGRPFSAFTLGVMEALAGADAAGGDGLVRLSNIIARVQNTFEQRTGGRQHPAVSQSPAGDFAVAYYAGGAIQPGPPLLDRLPFVESRPGLIAGQSTAAEPPPIVEPPTRPPEEAGLEEALIGGDIFQPGEAMIGGEDIIGIGKGIPKGVEAQANGGKPPVRPASQRLVSTGFADRTAFHQPLQPNQPLQTAAEYFFWLEVGPPVKGSIETTPTALPVEMLPPDALLDVVVFPFPGSLELVSGATRGVLKLQPDGTVTVSCQPAAMLATPDIAVLLEKRLFFPVRAPARSGMARLRCNIYFQNILVQSRLVQAKVMRKPAPARNALRSRLDYTLSRSLRFDALARHTPHRLSLMLNDNGDGTHAFRFRGGASFDSTATFDALELQDLIEQARGALRMAAWGDADEWEPGKTYCYTGDFSRKRLMGDLTRLAIRGYRFYDQLINRLAGEGGDPDALTDLMRKSGLVQIAFKESERLLVPAALIYDAPLDTSLTDFKLCPAFEGSLAQPAPLEETACFQGDCPSYGETDTICPSGFWGFRHALGMPVSIGRNGLDAEADILYRQTPSLVAGFATDPNFRLRQAHEDALESITQKAGWQIFEGMDRANVIKLMREQKSQVVYFYCHGGLVGNLPFILVGGENDRGITRDNLRSERIRWRENRPLVFINGCHTTALEPEKAFNFVSAFIETSFASGVIGTEISIFEPLARGFSEEFLPRFLKGEAAGQSVRLTRLALLKAGNPLGLVYIPFVLADLKLVQAGG